MIAPIPIELEDVFKNFRDHRNFATNVGSILSELRMFLEKLSGRLEFCDWSARN